MALSSMQRRLLQEIRAVGHKLNWACQESDAAHVYSAAMAYVRSTAASVVERDPDDMTWTQIAFAMMETPQDIICLGHLLLHKASCMGGLFMEKHDAAFRSMLACTAGDRALDIASLLLRADGTCCTQPRRQLACRSYYCLMTAAYSSGNIVEACKVKWVVDRLDSKAFESLSATVEKHKVIRAFQRILGDVRDILGAFRSVEGLIEVPKAWRHAIAVAPGASSWYLAHVSCQATHMRSHTAFHKAMQSHLINCGTYKAQPVFVIRHRTGMRALSDPPYTYSVHTCRLQEKDGRKMESLCLRVLEGVRNKYTLGAVSGSTLHLTSFMPPILGAVLRVDLARDVEPQLALSCGAPKFQREVDTMIALGGDLYVYGGIRRTPEGQDIVLTDILVARAKEGIVNQPWKRLAIRKCDRQPPKRAEYCFFGHKSPKGRFSLYLFGGMQIKGATRNDVDYPLNDLWELDVATRKWSELEQRGTRPCARTMTHGAFMSPDGQKALIAGGVTVLAGRHFCMERDPRDPFVIHLPDVFELDLNTTCWVQIVPKGNKWTSAFSICGGGYLKSNHIGLLGLSRFAGEPSAAGEKPDWTTAVNIRVHRGSDTVSNILAWDRHGFERDRVLEMIAKAKVEQRNLPTVQQDLHKLALLGLDSSRSACIILSQNLTVPVFASLRKMPQLFASMLKSRHEPISDVGDSLKLKFDEPWLHPELCPFSAGPHWLGGYNQVSAGTKRSEPLTKEQQTTGGPWVESMQYATRSFPSPRAAVEYFRLMLPPWDEREGLHNWKQVKNRKYLEVQVSFERDWQKIETTELALFVYKFRSRPNVSPRQEVFAVYTMVVSCHTFAAHLLEMKAPTVPDKSDSADPDSSWPYHKDNLNAISESLVNIVSSSIDEAGTNYQCSYCGRSWHSKADKHKQRPKVCECQMTRYCSQDCQFRQWRVHKPICKAARQPGGITREQALSFMLTETLQ